MVLVVSGELDMASSPELEQAIERAQGSAAELLVLDLRDLQFMDSPWSGAAERRVRWGLDPDRVR
jgi:anti-anti-sigma factor